MLESVRELRQRGGCACIQIIWPDPRNGFLYTLPGTDPDNNGQGLVGGRWKPLEGEVGLGKPLADTRSGLGVRVDPGKFLRGSSPGGANFWSGDVGGDPPYGEEPGGFPPQVGAMYHG